MDEWGELECRRSTRVLNVDNSMKTREKFAGSELILFEDHFGTRPSSAMSLTS